VRSSKCQKIPSKPIRPKHEKSGIFWGLFQKIQKLENLVKNRKVGKTVKVANIKKVAKVANIKKVVKVSKINFVARVHLRFSRRVCSY